ncbi:hypothetical protein DPEC_G00333770 [Dallia pectoralis]|uniref:Uncharacterized protein n=1 Tax=Dallia pectoralis TaxID=75939 RepID=A0ACC2F6I2_DALPE|nr:hypothetical protein DPEC_G00333770 [Dallia pectoralis]
MGTVVADARVVSFLFRTISNCRDHTSPIRRPPSRLALVCYPLHSCVGRSLDRPKAALAPPVKTLRSRTTRSPSGRPKNKARRAVTQSPTVPVDFPFTALSLAWASMETQTASPGAFPRGPRPQTSPQPL